MDLEIFMLESIDLEVAEKRPSCSTVSMYSNTVRTLSPGYASVNNLDNQLSPASPSGKCIPGNHCSSRKSITYCFDLCGYQCLGIDSRDLANTSKACERKAVGFKLGSCKVRMVGIHLFGIPLK